MATAALGRREMSAVVPVECSRRALYMPPRGLRASFHIAMDDYAPSRSCGQGRPSKYAMAEEARAAPNAARCKSCLEEAPKDEAAAVARREQHESSTESSLAEGPTRVLPSHL